MFREVCIVRMLPVSATSFPARTALGVLSRSANVFNEDKTTLPTKAPADVRVLKQERFGGA